MLMRQFGFHVDGHECIEVKEGDTFSFGKHTVTFVGAPLVHWPEAMAVSYTHLHVEVVDTNGSGHGVLAGFLMQKGVDTLICGGIGGGAQAALAEAGIKLYGGVSGDADAAVNALLSGNLGHDPNVHCDHHDHKHGEEMCIRDSSRCAIPAGRSGSRQVRMSSPASSAASRSRRSTGAARP